MAKFVPKAKATARMRRRVSSEPIEQYFTDVATARPVPPQWVIKDLIPAGLTVLQGPPKEAFKSTIAIIMAVLCARWQCNALPPWAEPVVFGKTLLWALEAEAGEINWLIRTGLRVEPDDHMLWYAMNPWEYKLDTEGDVSKVLQWVRGENPALTILDPFRNMWAGDENDSGAIVQAIRPIQVEAKAQGHSVLMVHHTVKPGEGKNMGSMYAGRGSSSLPGLADAILTIEPGPSQGQVWINAVFKRGASYRRLVQLGCPGFGWPAQGREVLTEEARRIRVGLINGETFVDITQGMNAFKAAEAMELLTRNRMVPNS